MAPFLRALVLGKPALIILLIAWPLVAPPLEGYFHARRAYSLLQTALRAASATKEALEFIMPELSLGRYDFPGKRDLNDLLRDILKAIGEIGHLIFFDDSEFYVIGPCSFMQYFHSILVFLAKLKVLACLVLELDLLPTHVGTLDGHFNLFGPRGNHLPRGLRSLQGQPGIATLMSEAQLVISCMRMRRQLGQPIVIVFLRLLGGIISIKKFHHVNVLLFSIE